MPKFKDVADTMYTVNMRKPKKVKDLNPNTNRIKTFKRVRKLTTTVPPEDRSTKNMPTYADGRSKVTHTEWLGIQTETGKARNGNTSSSFGKSTNGKWYGWSHRAIYGFKVGDTIKTTDCGNVDQEEYTIKTDDQARQAAIDFAEDVS